MGHLLSLSALEDAERNRSAEELASRCVIGRCEILSQVYKCQWWSVRVLNLWPQGRLLLQLMQIPSVFALYTSFGVTEGVWHVNGLTWICHLQKRHLTAHLSLPCSDWSLRNQLRFLKKVIYCLDPFAYSLVLHFLLNHSCGSWSLGKYRAYLELYLHVVCTQVNVSVMSSSKTYGLVHKYPALGFHCTAYSCFFCVSMI